MYRPLNRTAILRGCRTAGLLAFVGELLLGGVSLDSTLQRGIANAAQPEVSSSVATTVERAAFGVKVYANERFSDQEGRSGLCDVYCPQPALSATHKASTHASPSQEKLPAVIVVHGGGWISGDKWTLEGYSRSLAEHGMVAITINYRLAPEHKFPAQVDDVRSALLWAKRNAERFSIDIDRLGLFGYSAGGHLSALVASLANESLDVCTAASLWGPADTRWNELPKVHAVCAGGPPCDFRSLQPDNATLAYFLGGSRREKPDVYIAASPAAHVSPGDPVTQLIHGESDLLVPLSESRQFHELQRQAGIDTRMEIIPDQGHLMTFLHPKTNALVLAFFQEVFVEKR